MLLLRQDLVSPGGDNASRVFRPDQFLDLNSDDPTAPLFSRMKDLQKYRRRKGKEVLSVWLVKSH